MKRDLVIVACLFLLSASLVCAMIIRPAIILRIDEDTHTGTFVVTNPVFNYSFETWIGDLVNDDSPNALTITNYGATQIVAGVSSFGRTEHAARFDGTNDYLARSYNAVMSNNVGTLMWWHKLNPPLPATLRSIFCLTKSDVSDNDIFWIRYVRSGDDLLDLAYRARFTLNNTMQWTIDSTNYYGLSYTNWHHFAIVQNGTNRDFFVDGSQAPQQGATPGGAWFNDMLAVDQFSIGAVLLQDAPRSGYPTFDGEIDSFIYFDRWMLQAEIAVIMTNTFPLNNQEYR